MIAIWAFKQSSTWTKKAANTQRILSSFSRLRPTRNTRTRWGFDPNSLPLPPFSDKDSFAGTSTHRRPRRRCGHRQAESFFGDLQLSRLHHQWQSRVPVSHCCPWQCCKHYCLYNWLLLIGGYVRCGQNLRFSERKVATLASPLSFCIVFKSSVWHGFR